MIKIKEIEIKFPKWWQTGLIILAIVALVGTIIIAPNKVVNITEALFKVIASS